MIAASVIAGRDDTLSNAESGRLHPVAVWMPAWCAPLVATRASRGAAAWRAHAERNLRMRIVP